ncbi:Mannose-6-phosphate isomerase, partial [Linderina macrospora]
MSVIRLTCNANNYAWGKHGASSKAAQFAATNPNVTIDPTQPYSELWMGTHPSGPSTVFGTTTLLSSVVDSDPTSALGSAVVAKFGPHLPYLFKVLSIEKALSIQAHPDKKLAEKLHTERPHVYKDPNHKPEMSIALTEFIAMSGFRPLEQIAQNLQEYPEFRALVSASADAFQKEAATGGDVQEKKLRLKALFAELMNSNPEVVERQLVALLERVPKSADPMDLSLPALVHRLNAEYPGDVGVFCVFMLNVLHLHAGDAFYMGPNDPHAYIYGDCVECMATSDNVVRAGLTPKLRDVPVLVDMLMYDFGTPEGKLLKAPKVLEHSSIYDPPIDEFAVVCTQLAKGESENLKLNGPQTLIATEGSGKLVAADKEYELKPGYV